MFREMQAALGELEESLSLRQHVAQRQAATAAGGGATGAGAGRRTRRQTQFYRL
jgi:hypothetical protein